MQQLQLSPLADQPTASYPVYQVAPSFQQAYVPPQQLRELPQSYIQTEQASRCGRCGKEFSFFDRLDFDKKTHRCRTCNIQIEQALQRFRAKFLEVTSHGTLNSIEWSALQHLAAQERLDMSEALTFINKDAVIFVQRVVTQAESSSGITDDVEQHIYQLLKILAIQPEIAHAIVTRLAEVKRRANIKLLER